MESHIAGNLWQVQVVVGQIVKAGDVLVILESMKMEITLEASCDRIVKEVRAQPGTPIRVRQALVIVVELQREKAES